MRQPLGIVIVGGLCVSQMLTLYITPVIYYYLDFVDSYISGGAKREAPAPEPIGELQPVPVHHPAE